MGIRAAGAAEITAPFVADAIGRGKQPPIRIVDQDARGWVLLDRGGDTLVVDEYAELWWCRRPAMGSVRSIRPCWPEESTRLRDDIAAATASILRTL